jgi:hypothetical protein
MVAYPQVLKAVLPHQLSVDLAPLLHPQALYQLEVVLVVETAQA